MLNPRCWVHLKPATKVLAGLKAVQNTVGSVASYTWDVLLHRNLSLLHCKTHTLLFESVPWNGAARSVFLVDSLTICWNGTQGWVFWVFKLKQIFFGDRCECWAKGTFTVSFIPLTTTTSFKLFPMPFTLTVFPSQAKQLESWKRSAVRRVIKTGIDAAGSQGSVTSLGPCVTVMSDTVALPCAASLCVFYCLMLPEDADPGVAGLCKHSVVEGSVLWKPLTFPL